MVFDIGFGEFLALAVVALLVLGPDKLPKFAADAAHFLRTVRRMASDARAEVRDSLGPELSELRDISLDDLDPRRFVTRHVLDGDDDVIASETGDGSSAAGSEAWRSQPLRPGERPPYDADAT